MVAEAEGCAPSGEAAGAGLAEPGEGMALGAPKSGLPGSARKLSRGRSWALPSTAGE